MPDRSAADPAELREAALRLLARREHGWVELKRKLERKGWDGAAAATVLDRLAEQGLQSDERFAEGFARTRAEKFYGPLRIRAELAERGVDRGLIERALQALDVDWLAQAAKWYGRRFGESPPEDIKERSRRSQALARRGFDTSVVREITD